MSFEENVRMLFFIFCILIPCLSRAQSSDTLKASLPKVQVAIGLAADVSYVNYFNIDAKDYANLNPGYSATGTAWWNLEVLQNLEAGIGTGFSWYQQKITFLRSSNEYISDLDTTVIDAFRKGIIEFSNLSLIVPVRIKLFYLNRPRVFVELGASLKARIISKDWWSYEKTTFFDLVSNQELNPPIVESFEEDYPFNKVKIAYSLGTGFVVPGKNKNSNWVISVNYQYLPFDLGFRNKVKLHAFGLEIRKTLGRKKPKKETEK